MIANIDKIDLAQNLKNGLTLQFVDRIEKSGEINSEKIKRIRELVETKKGKPKAGMHWKI